MLSRIFSTGWSGITLIIFSVNFKIALWMSTNRTNFGCFCSDYDMTAITALPDFDFAFFKYRGCLNIFQQSTVAFFVMLFDLRNHAEFFCKFRKAFFFRCFCKVLIHVRPFVIFAFSGCRFRRIHAYFHRSDVPRRDAHDDCIEHQDYTQEFLPAKRLLHRLHFRIRRRTA